jgi:two-component system sensor histidine kinase HydH
MSIHHSYLERIFQEVQRLDKIVQQVEEYALISSSVFRREKIEEVVEKALQSFSIEAGKKKIAFRLEARSLGENGYCFIDKGLVVKALCHIFRNALESMTKIPARGKRAEVKVILSEREGKIHISISDKGEGVAKKDRDHIFEPFFSTRTGQMGLGLTFVKKVMEEHKGEVQMESRVKRGTTVTLIFPKDRRRKVRRELIAPGAA